MKKCVVLLLAILFAFSLVVVAEAKAAEFKQTNIGVFIDDHPIKAFNMNGSMYVIAEDLRGYGFDVNWNGNKKRIDITRNGIIYYAALAPEEINIKKSEINTSKTAYTARKTSIKTYLNGELIESHNIGGKTIVKLGDFAKIGYIDFDEEKRCVYAEFTRYELESELEKLENCEAIELNKREVYYGEVVDGKPNGLGKIVETSQGGLGFKMIVGYEGRDAVYAGDAVDAEKSGNVYKAELVKLGYFKDGKRHGKSVEYGEYLRTVTVGTNGKTMTFTLNQKDRGMFYEGKPYGYYYFQGHSGSTEDAIEISNIWENGQQGENRKYFEEDKNLYGLELIAICRFEDDKIVEYIFGEKYNSHEIIT